MVGQKGFDHIVRLRAGSGKNEIDTTELNSNRIAIARRLSASEMRQVPVTDQQNAITRVTTPPQQPDEFDEIQPRQVRRQNTLDIQQVVRVNDQHDRRSIERG